MTTAALQWTATAREGLDRYFAVRLTTSRLEGADAVEVRADLLTHLEEELSGERVTMVTLEDLRRTLARMGESLPLSPEEQPLAGAPGGARGGEGTASAPEAEAPSPVAGIRKGGAGDASASWTGPWPWRHQGRPMTSFWITWMALWLPLITFVFEVMTRGCVGMLFDPMPTWLHHALVLIVPLSAWGYLRVEREKGPVWLPRAVPWLAGAALAVSCFYALCFLPVAPVAIPGIIFAGTGLLALAPLLAFTAMLQMRRRIRKFGEPGALRRLRVAFWLTLGLMILLDVPMVLTENVVKRVTNPAATPEAWSSAARTVRRFGSETALLRSASGLERGSTTVLLRAVLESGFESGMDGDRRSSAPERMAAARELYYRVTGRSFDGVDSPAPRGPLVDNGFNNGWHSRIDEDRGGTQVAGKIEGLALGQSRMDWHCENASGLTWGEWTLTFTNATGRPEEARCRIALPPGGFVSRVTLWVNGEPQEAAYSTVSRVRAAYQAVAVKERRDPVLVTQPDAGSVLVQAFPVPAGGQLKTRISFTVPAGLDGRVWLPSLLERNFMLEPSGELSLWVQADQGTLELPARLKPHVAVESGARTVTGWLGTADFTGLGTSFVWHQRQAAPVVFCEDPLASGPDRKIVVRREAEPRILKPGAVAWVIDTSAPMAARREEIEGAFRRFSVPGKTSVFLPGETARTLVSTTDGTLPPLEFEGGRDNSPALAAAMEWVRGQPDACLIWIHGMQPLEGAARETLDQLLDRGTAPLTIVEVPVTGGENRLSARLVGRPRISVLTARVLSPEAVAAGGDGSGGNALAAAVEAAFHQRGGDFTTSPAGTAPPEGAVRVSDSLARWMACGEAFRLGLEHPAEASVMAAAHQIVTPWSGAVVLEKAEDYAKNNLAQADAANAQVVPTIPEPSGALLLLLSASHFLFRRKRAGL